MNKLIALAKKECRTSFHSPLFFLIFLVLSIIFNAFFFMIIDQNREASMRDMYKLMEFMFLFVIPLLTMKSFSEEKQNGTMEFLITTPTTTTVLVLGKYLGSLFIAGILTSFAWVYLAVIAYYGQPDIQTAIVGLIGLILEVAFFVAVGIFMSSLTQSQIVSALLTYVVLFISYFSVSALTYFDGFAEQIIYALGTWHHLELFISGVISLASVIFYLAGILLSLALTRVSIKANVWK